MLLAVDVVVLVVVVDVWVVELDVGRGSVVVSCNVGLTDSDSDGCLTGCIELSADAKLLMKSLMSNYPVSTGASSRLWRNTVGSN